MYAVILRLNHFFLSACDQPSAKRNLIYHHFQQQIPASTTFEPNFYGMTAGMSSPALFEKNGTLPDFSTTLCVSPAILPTRLLNNLSRLRYKDWEAPVRGKGGCYWENVFAFQFIRQA